MFSVRRGIAIGAVAALVLSLVPGNAGADVLARRDPKDTAGRLDIRRISHGHVGDDAVTHTITMHRRFSSKLFQRSGKARGHLLMLMLDRFEPGWDFMPDWIRIMDVRWRNGRLRAPIWEFDLLRETVRRIGTAKVSRPNRRTLQVTVRLTHLGDLGDPRQYFWITESAFIDGAKCKRPCWDSAPNGRPIRHVLPNVAPEEPPEESDAHSTSEAAGARPPLRVLGVLGVLGER